MNTTIFKGDSASIVVPRRTVTGSNLPALIFEVAVEPMAACFRRCSEEVQLLPNGCESSLVLKNARESNVHPVPLELLVECDFIPVA